MAHLDDYVTGLNDIVRLDGPLQRGPPMRWQRKAQERKAQETLIRINSEDGGVSSPMRMKKNTPGKHTPGNKAKTPSGNKVKTPSGNRAKTPSGKGDSTRQRTPGFKLDRFIPNRSSMDMEYGHYAVTKGPEGEAENQKGSPPQYDKTLAGAMGVDKHRILSFNAKAPVAAANDISNLRVLYDCKSTKKNAATTRYIPKEPERVLDAPDLMNDYYLNLIDWSSFNILSVGLGNDVFLWNAGEGTIVHLMTLTGDDYVSSLSWIQEGAILAVGLSTGAVQLWDTAQEKMLRTMSGHPTRVGALSWNQHILSSGSRSGAIHHHDVRVPNHHVGTLQSHSQEVCGLKWSPTGRYLASGGNDNLVCVWSNQMASSSPQSPLHNFTHHQAAVKALAWCPWQPDILATGGGTSDRHIRMWNAQSGASLGATDTESQVCALLWSSDHKELISGHGYSLNHLRIWKYPTMNKVTDLLGHSARILAMALSPDGTTVASAAGDETIRLWKCFAVDEEVKKAQQKVSVKKLTSGLDQCIR